MTRKEAALATYHAARLVAEDADDALSDILIESYGPKRASLMRYLPPETDEIAAAMHAKLNADRSSLNAWTAYRQYR